LPEGGVVSVCISQHGEFSNHAPENGDFVCGRCGELAWDELMDHIARLSERLDLAVTMHGVQLERANRVTAERDTQHAAAALLAETLAFRTDELDQMAGALADMTHERNDASAGYDALVEAVRMIVAAFRPIGNLPATTEEILDALDAVVPPTAETT
jgi:hypothetical protein